MKKKNILKNIAVIMLITVVLSSLLIPVSAREIETDDLTEHRVKAKVAFASSKDQQLKTDLKQGKIKSFNESEVNSLKEAYSFSSSLDEKIELASKLEEYGVYVFTDATEEKRGGISTYALIGAFPTSGANDMTLNTPTIFYDGSAHTWTVTCGGSWNNDNYAPYIGIGKKIGDPDAFGVGFTSIKNNYTSYVVSAYAYLEDSLGINRTTTYNRSDGDGSKGFGFRLQDEYQAYALTQSLYVGYRWYGSCTYDYNFVYYSCVATGYYIHTYSSAEITGINFGVDGKTAGISVSISNVQKSFEAYSADLKLG